MSESDSHRPINKHLAEIELRIYDAIKFENFEMFKDLGGTEQIDLNFRIEIDRNTSYYPIQLASTKGSTEMVAAILSNPSLDINIQDPESGINSFWLAAYFGHGDIMQLLAEAGIDVLNKHSVTKSNALHVAVERNHPHIVRMLIKSGFPID